MDLVRSILKLKSPEGCHPDFERLKRAITTREPGPVPFGDMFADVETVGAFLRERVFDYGLVAADPRHRISAGVYIDIYRYIEQTIRFCLLHGWDYAYAFSIIPFNGFDYDLAENTAPAAGDHKRFWVNDHRGPIQSWEDFERYTWPSDIGGITLTARLMAKRVPDGMKVLVIPGGVFEWTSWLMGLVPFSYALVEQPDLVDAMIGKVSRLIQAVVTNLMEEPNIGGIFLGDDLGFATSTLVSPRILRQKFLPETKKIIDLTHAAGRLFLFHSCGNMYPVMEDLISMGIDGKHSYEDKILPVEEAYQRWGDRVAILGGLDMNIIAGSSEEDVRVRTRQVLDVCGRQGHYILGTGNSVANYVPLANYHAILDEGRKWNRDHFPKV